MAALSGQAHRRFLEALAGGSVLLPLCLSCDQPFSIPASIARAASETGSASSQSANRCAYGLYVGVATTVSGHGRFLAAIDDRGDIGSSVAVRRGKRLVRGRPARDRGACQVDRRRARGRCAGRGPEAIWLVTRSWAPRRCRGPDGFEQANEVTAKDLQDIVIAESAPHQRLGQRL